MIRPSGSWSQAFVISDELLRAAHDVLQVLGHPLRGLAEQLAHLAHIPAGLRFVDFRRTALASFGLA
jgi:hypothetical protein